MVPAGRPLPRDQDLAWLCDLAQSPLLLQPQSFHLYRGFGKGWTLSPKPYPLIFPQTSSLCPVPFGCFGCEASGCPIPSVPSTAWLSLSPSAPCHSLSPPPSLPLLSGWALACSSLLCLWTPAPARPGSHSDGCKGTSTPSPPPPSPEPEPCPESSSLFLFPSPLPGADSVEGPGHWGSATSFSMTRCVTLGTAQFSLVSLSPEQG